MIDVRIKDILEEDVSDEEKTHHKGRRRKKDYIPVYDKIESGAIPFIVTIGNRRTAWNLYIAIRNYIVYHKDTLGHIKITFEGDKKGKWFLKVFKKTIKEEE